jgi:hypothetical protein
MTRRRNNKFRISTYSVDTVSIFRYCSIIISYYAILQYTKLRKGGGQHVILKDKSMSDLDILMAYIYL